MFSRWQFYINIQDFNHDTVFVAEDAHQHARLLPRDLLRASRLHQHARPLPREHSHGKEFTSTCNTSPIRACSCPPPLQTTKNKNVFKVSSLTGIGMGLGWWPFLGCYILLVVPHILQTRMLVSKMCSLFFWRAQILCLTSWSSS
jgi:hypothetical protein